MRYIISLVWILGGLFLVYLGGERYWIYSTPNTFWLGMIPEFFAIGHLWLGAHSILVGFALFRARSTAMLYLRTFLLVLVVLIVLTFGREFMIYGQWIANDYLKDELLLLLYGVLGIGSIKCFHFPIPDQLFGEEGLFDKQSSTTILAFIISINAIPSTVPYHYLQFLH